MVEDGGADEACGSGEDEMHFADGWRSWMEGRKVCREEFMERKGERDDELGFIS